MLVLLSLFRAEFLFCLKDQKSPYETDLIVFWRVKRFLDFLKNKHERER